MGMEMDMDMDEDEDEDEDEDRPIPSRRLARPGTSRLSELEDQRSPGMSETRAEDKDRMEGSVSTLRKGDWRPCETDGGFPIRGRWNRDSTSTCTGACLYSYIWWCSIGTEYVL
jgi:hypothetical protein